MKARGRSRWWRWPLFGLLGSLGLLLVVAGLLQTSFAREQVRIRVNAALGPLFEGRIQIDRLGRMGLSGVAGVDARVFDPEGKQVIRVQGLEARAALHVLAWELAFGGPSPQLELQRVRIDFADVTLRSDEELGVTVARAFMPVETSTPEEPSDGSVELRIPAIELGRVWAHGHAGGSPPLDADLLELRADLSQARDGFMLELQRTELVTRGLPGAAEPRGTVWGAIDVPSEEGRPLKLEGYVDGHAAGSPLWLETSWVGDDLYARVSLPRLPASYVNEQASGLALQGELTVLAEVQGSLPELELNADVQGDAAHVAVHAEAVLADGLEAVVAVAASGVNLAGVVQGAPPSRLDARMSAFLLEGEDGQYSGAHRVEIGQGVLAGVATPPAWVNGGLALGSDGRLEARGNWHASDAGAELGGLYGVSLHDSPKDVVTASAQGTLRDPARLDSLGIRTAGSVRARAEFWPNTERIDAKLDLSLGHLDYQMLQARSVEVQASATGSVKHPRVHAATTLELFSGRAHADLLYADDSQELSLFLADLDGQRLARALGVELPFEPANLNLDAHLTRKPGTRLPMQLDGTLRADFGEIGSVRLTARELALPSDPGKGSELIGASGELVAQGRLDLAKVKKLGELVGMPLERTTGIVRFELAGRRSESAAEPELSLLVDTNGLRIVERRAPDNQITTTAEAVDNQPFALEGIDAHASLRFLPRSGELVGTVIARDRGGTLAELEAEAQLGQRWPANLNQQALLHAPLELHLEVARRRLQSLPALLRPSALRGQVALDAELSGSLADPRVRAWVTLDRLRSQRGDETVSLRANARYTPEAGELFVTARDGHETDAGRLNAHWQGDLKRALLEPGEAASLVASAEAELFAMPLEVVPMLSDRQLKGRLSGKVSLKDWGKDARFEARLNGKDLVVGSAKLPSITMAAKNQGDELLAEMSIKTTRGALGASFRGAARWGARPAPELGNKGVAKLSANSFELATLTPLVGAYVSEISGVLDANAEVAVDGPTSRVAGTANVSRGVVQVPVIGQRFSDITAKVALANGQLKLERLEARGLTGRVSVRGGARLDGFALRSADAHATIAKKEALPLTVEGAVLGDAWGDVKVAYQSPARGQRRLDIDVHEFHLTTPETEGHGLQDLDAAEGVRIGVRRSDGKFVSLPVQPLEPTADEAGSGEPAPPLYVHIRLGDNVTVARGRTAQVQLTGQLLAVSDGETQVTGRIELRGGKLDVQGKTFEIERGVITFDGRDPSNPTITATARWDGPEHTLYAEYVGDVENGRIKLRSEPPLSQDEIASLLLFGDPDGSAGGGDPNTAALAVSVAGDTAAQGLNQAISDFTTLDVRARVDTTTGSARPELALQVSPRVVAKVTRAIGEPGVGESPDRTFLTLELRLRRAWALSAVFGDHGASALDLIWRRRY